MSRNSAFDGQKPCPRGLHQSKSPKSLTIIHSYGNTKTICMVIFFIAVLALWTCIGLGLLWVASAASLIAVPIIAVVFVLSLIFGRKE